MGLHHDPDIKPFTASTDKMERGLEEVPTMLYKRFGWDEELGCPTKQCLADLGLEQESKDLRSLACWSTAESPTTSARASTTAC